LRNLKLFRARDLDLDLDLKGIVTAPSSRRRRRSDAPSQ
jgi:hypothetical protein